MGTFGHDEDPRLITAITPTVCALLSIDPPSLSERRPLSEVTQRSHEALAGHPVQRCLIFCPDAIGAWLPQKYPSMFAGVLARTPLRVTLRSVMPPKTPVCWASVFTGALPEVHGIRAVSPRPTFHGDTLFDALIRAHKKTAIVAVTDSSIDRVFRGRDLDYFAERYDPEVTARVLALLEAGGHDIIVAYQQEYDDVMHQSTPESPDAIRAVAHHVDAFRFIADAVARHWRSHNRAIMWLTDHGTHVDAATGRGTHGDDIPTDMAVEHFFGFQQAIGA
jgi:Type I phosphodiesterase / nucleotide pyrophosphatase